jgi:hypothetical protein
LYVSYPATGLGLTTPEFNTHGLELTVCWGAAAGVLCGIPLKLNPHFMQKFASSTT